MSRNSRHSRTPPHNRCVRTAAPTPRIGQRAACRSAKDPAEAAKSAESAPRRPRIRSSSRPRRRARTPRNAARDRPNGHHDTMSGCISPSTLASTRVSKSAIGRRGRARLRFGHVCPGIRPPAFMGRTGRPGANSIRKLALISRVRSPSVPFLPRAVLSARVSASLIASGAVPPGRAAAPRRPA